MHFSKRTTDYHRKWNSLLRLLLTRVLPCIVALPCALEAMDISTEEGFTTAPLITEGFTTPTAANGDSMEPQFSPAGNKIYFLSNASNLITEDQNGSLTDLFCYDIDSKQITSLTSPSEAFSNVQNVSQFLITQTGGDIYFTASVANPNESGDALLDQVFRWRADTEEISILSRSVEPDSPQQNPHFSNGNNMLLDASPDGSKLLIQTDADDLISSTDNNGPLGGLALYDRNIGQWFGAMPAIEGLDETSTHFSVIGLANNGGGMLIQTSLSVSTSNPFASPLHAGNQSDLVYVDFATASYRVIDFNPASGTTDYYISSKVQLSANGRFAAGLVKGSSNNSFWAPFWMDLQTGQLFKIMQTAQGQVLSDPTDIFLNHDGNELLIQDGKPDLIVPSYLRWSRSSPQATPVKLNDSNSTTASYWKVRRFAERAPLLWVKHSNGTSGLFSLQDAVLTSMEWVPEDASPLLAAESNLAFFSTRAPLDGNLDQNDAYDVYSGSIQSHINTPLLLSQSTHKGRQPSQKGLIDQPLHIHSQADSRSILFSHLYLTAPDSSNTSSPGGGAYRLHATNGEFQPLPVPKSSESASSYRSHATPNGTGDVIVYLNWLQDATDEDLETMAFVNDLMVYDATRNEVATLNDWIDVNAILIKPAQFTQPAIDTEGRWVTAFVISGNYGYQAVFDLEQKKATLDRLDNLTSMTSSQWKAGPIFSPDGRLTLIPSHSRRSNNAFVYDHQTATFLKLDWITRLVPNAQPGGAIQETSVQLSGISFSPQCMSGDGNRFACYSNAPANSETIGHFSWVDLSVIKQPVIYDVPLSGAALQEYQAWDVQTSPTMSRDGNGIILKSKTSLADEREVSHLVRYDIQSGTYQPVTISGEEVETNPELAPHYGQLLSYQIGSTGKWAQFKTKSDDGDDDTNQELVWFRNLRDGTLSRIKIPGVRFVGFPTWNTEARVGVIKALTGSLTHSTPEFFLITRTTNTPSDQDSDGLPDDWEAAYFTEGDATPEADSDGDGISNRLEFLAGTNPMDPLSVFRIETIEEVNGDTVRLQWPAMENKVYAVEYRDGITSDSWIKSGKPVQVNDGKAIYRDRVTVDRTFRFYRLAIEEP